MKLTSAFVFVQLLRCAESQLAPTDSTVSAEAAKIQVFVYNYAAVAPSTLAQAERLAAQIYTRAGLGAEFLDCPLFPDQAEQFPSCQLPVSPARLALRVLSRPMAERLGLTRTTFGSALFSPGGEPGMIAQVCAHCAEQLAKGSEEVNAIILGHVMAHELGHLLLGVGSHGATGLMHVPWHRRELEDAAQGALLFTPREAETLRRNAAARLSAAAPSQSAAK